MIHMSSGYNTVEGLERLGGLGGPAGGQRRRPRGGSSDASATTALRIGDRVVVTGNTNGHRYQIGRTYEVVHVDLSDSTVRARDLRTGNHGNWLRMSDLARASGVGWDWLKTVLPPDDVALLEQFEGLTELRLGRSLQWRLVAALPGLAAAIVAAGGKR